jgi:hypothetical protein
MNGTRHAQQNRMCSGTYEISRKVAIAITTPRLVAAFGNRREERAPARRRVFGGQRDRAREFRARAEALHHAQQHEQDRCDHARLLPGRQYAEPDGRRAHDRHAEYERGLAAVFIADMRYHDAAQRPDDEADREGRERGERACERRQLRIEQLVDDEARCRRIKPIVVPFDDGAERRREHGASDGPAVGFLRVCCLHGAVSCFSFMWPCVM